MPEDEPEFEAQFHRLASLWKREAGPVSSAKRMAEHPAYKRIISMGEKAVPLILRELRKSPDHWFIALRRIAGENPVPKEARGDIRKMADAWLKWGREHGYLEA